MKKMRRLIPAIAMLLVSAVMLSTASFAWFTMNTQVQATDMVVKAQASGGLAIASYTTETTKPEMAAFTNVASMVWSNANENKTLQPTSHDGTTWIAASAAAPNASAADADTYSVVEAGGEGYYLHSKWMIKSLAEESSETVYLTGINVAVTDENDYTAALKSSLRVAILVGGTYYYFAPCRNSQPTGVTLQNATYTPEVKDEEGTVTTEASFGTEAATLVFSAKPNTQLLTGLGQDAQDIEVFVYFEGEDPDCTSAYAIDAQNIAVTLTFATSKAQ